jgi:hypothetical protein
MEPDVHYRVRKSTPLGPIMSRLNPVHILQPYSDPYVSLDEV